MLPRTGYLYDAVAVGMWLYGHAAFDVSTLGPRRFELRPGTLVLATHRRETDVPLISPPLYFGARLWRDRSPRMSFAARDDMFLPGFFAGFPPVLAPRLRRLLFRVGVGSMLPRVQVYPLRSATVARLAEVLRERPGAALADALTPELADAFAARAAASGLARPVAARDVMRGEYADLLWRAVSSADVRAVAQDGFWSRRAAQATADFRTLVELVRGGGILVVFPEGRPSPDGEIGPVLRGVAALVRRAEPAFLQPVAPAYDALTRGRTKAFVSIGEAVRPPSDDVDRAVLALLRRTTPLTCGQVVAHAVVTAKGERPPLAELERAVRDAAEAARAEGRRIEAALLDPETRRRRVADARAAAAVRPGVVAYLAREYASARAGERPR